MLTQVVLNLLGGSGMVHGHELDAIATTADQFIYYTIPFK